VERARQNMTTAMERELVADENMVAHGNAATMDWLQQWPRGGKDEAVARKGETRDQGWVGGWVGQTVVSAQPIRGEEGREDRQREMVNDTLAGAIRGTR
jgi:hypothetical protein